MFTARNPGQHAGKFIGTGHCVPFVQHVSNAPHTSHWRRGRQVRGNRIPPSTVIATFGLDGRYENDTTGRSHAAILIAQHDDGSMTVWDQWIGQPVHQRVIRARGGQGLKVDDADQFFAVEVGSDLA